MHTLDLGHGIVAIDTGFGRPRFDAAYLIHEGGRAAFVDSGTQDGVPRMMQALASAGLGPEAVDYVMLTHVHLDHAGGAGRLMALCPNAKLVVHARGARHMIDPSALIAGASAVYGADEVRRTYGDLPPVAADRVVSPADGDVLELGGRPLRFIDTPGHARHHLAIWDAASRGWFTGDTFGLSYPELSTPQGRYIFPTTTPVQFEPEPLHTSIDRLLAADPQRVYLTHFGMLEDVRALAVQLHGQLDAMVELARALARADDRHVRLRDGLLDIYARHYHALGGTLDRAALAEALAIDLELNAQGLAVWLDRPAK